MSDVVSTKTDSSSRVASLMGRHRPLIVLLLVCLLLGITTLIMPFGRDQGIHAYTAWRVLEGDVLYRDVFCVKPPMTTPTHMVALSIFGHTMTAVRALDLLLHLALAWMLASLVWRGTGAKWLGVITGIIFSYTYFSLDFWSTAQTDGWLSVWATGGLLALFGLLESNGKSKEIPWAFLAGALIGFAVLYKYTIGMLLPFGWVLIFIHRPTRKIKTALLLATGFTVALLLVAIVLWMNNAIDGFLDCQYRLLSVYKNTRNSFPFETIYMHFPAPVLLGVLGIPVALITRFKPGASLAKTERILLDILLLWIVAALISVVVQGKYFIYQFLPILPPLAAIGVWGAWKLLAKALAPRKRWIKIFLAPVVLLMLVIPPFGGRYVEVARVLFTERTLSDTFNEKNQFATTDYALADNLALADYLSKNTAPEDKVNIFGIEPAVNFLSRRGTVSRYLYTFPVHPQFNLPSFRQEYLDALAETPPTYFIVQAGDWLGPALGYNADSLTVFLSDTELNLFVQQHYDRVAQIGRIGMDAQKRPVPRFHVYRRISSHSL